MRKVNGIEIRHRMSDGYIDALAICDACNKDFADYIQIRFTQRFLRELLRSTGMNESELIQKVDGIDEICTPSNRNQPITMGLPKIGGKSSYVDNRVVHETRKGYSRRSNH